MKKIVLVAISAFVSTCFVAGSAVAQNSADAQFGKSVETYLSSEPGQDFLAKLMPKIAQRAQKFQMEEKVKAQEEALENQFKNPIKVDLGSAPVKGPATAKVTVVEFSDFQCPYCKRGHDTIEQVVAAYPKDVKVAFKHFPLDFHPEAEPASRAAWAAGKQGKFWEMYSALFKNQSSLGAATYERLAKEIGLNVDTFKTDWKSDAAKAAVAADVKQGGALGIQGTPRFYVNGVSVEGAYPIEYFKQIIDRHLKGGK